MTRRLVTLLAALLASPLLAQAAVLEVPTNGGHASGIGYISGWKCPPNDNIDIVFDGNAAAPLPAATGIRRGDTAGVCRNNGRNGFISQFSFGLLGDGVHVVRVRQGGTVFAQATFTVSTFGVPFMSGAAGAFVLDDFPSPGGTTTIRWDEGTQNFVIIDTTVAPPPTPRPSATPRPSPSPPPTPSPIPTPSPTPVDAALVRFENGVTCNGIRFDASMSANGYGWTAFSGEVSEYVEVKQRFLGPITTVLGGCGRFNFGTFSLTLGRRYRIFQAVGPTLIQYDEGSFAGAVASSEAVEAMGAVDQAFGDLSDELEFEP